MLAYFRFGDLCYGALMMNYGFGAICEGCFISYCLWSMLCSFDCVLSIIEHMLDANPIHCVARRAPKMTTWQAQMKTCWWLSSPFWASSNLMHVFMNSAMVSVNSSMQSKIIVGSFMDYISLLHFWLVELAPQTIRSMISRVDSRMRHRVNVLAVIERALTKLMQVRINEMAATMQMNDLIARHILGLRTISREKELMDGIVYFNELQYSIAVRLCTCLSLFILPLLLAFNSLKQLTSQRTTTLN